MNYPAHWWAPIHDPFKPYWEILPQQAAYGEVILSKRNELGILSNFALTPFEFKGKKYKSVESLWQSMFYPESENDDRAHHANVKWYLTRAQVAELESHDAYAAGVIGYQNMQKMGINYVTLNGKKYEYWVKTKNEHYDLIVEIMKAKLNQNPRVKEILKSTGDLILRADHFEPKEAPPSWAYYKIWMDIRATL